MLYSCTRMATVGVRVNSLKKAGDQNDDNNPRATYTVDAFQAGDVFRALHGVDAIQHSHPLRAAPSLQSTHKFAAQSIKSNKHYQTHTRVQMHNPDQADLHCLRAEVLTVLQP